MSSCKRCAFPADAVGRAGSCNNVRLDAKQKKNDDADDDDALDDDDDDDDHDDDADIGSAHDDDYVG